MVILATNKTLLNDAIKTITNNKVSTDIGTEVKSIIQERDITLQESNLEDSQVKVSFIRSIINWFKRVFG
jgi:hypothetical protein